MDGHLLFSGKALKKLLKSKELRKTFLVLSFFLFLFFLFGTPFGMRLLGVGPKVDLLNHEAYEFSAFSLNGSFFEFRKNEEIVLLLFFSLDCPSCIAEIGILKDMEKRFPPDFSIIAINVDGMNSIEELKEFIEKENLWFRVVIDQDGSIASRYGVYSLPTSFLIDKNFMVRFRFMGPILNENYLLKSISQLNG